MNAAIASFAAIPDKNIVIKTSDGSATCALKAIRRITFEDGMMLIDMKDGSAYSWNTDWVNCVTLGEAESNLETGIVGVLQSAVFTVTDNVLSVDCCAQTRIQLCACDGKVVYDAVCTGAFSLDMATLPAGIYLLKLDCNTYKILNR
jgi:hypothetical protein